MPTYGKNKVRDMVRSVLPSTRRKNAKQRKDALHREYRRTARHEIQARAPDEFDDWSNETREYRVEQSSIVRDRRDADKVKPLMRWAPKATKGQHDKRMATLKAILPDNVIGQHARGHVQYVKEFENPNDPWQMKLRGYKNRPYLDKAKVRFDWLTKMLRERPWLHRELNLFLKKGHVTARIVIGEKVIKATGTKYYVFKNVGPTSPRLLLGISDVKPFLEDLKKANIWSMKDQEGRRHPEWTDLLDKFIELNPL